MKKNLKNFWEGKVSFGQSFWLWYIIGGSALSIPFFVISDESIESSAGHALFTILYFIFFVCALIFLIIGAWKSAENYKKIKKKKKTRFWMGNSRSNLYWLSNVKRSC